MIEQNCTQNYEIMVIIHVVIMLIDIVIMLIDRASIYNLIAYKQVRCRNIELLLLNRDFLLFIYFGR